MAVVVVSAFALTIQIFIVTTTETQKSCYGKIDTEGLPSVSEAITGAAGEGDARRWTYGRQKIMGLHPSQATSCTEQRNFFAFLRSKSLCCSVALRGELHWRNERQQRMHHCDAKLEQEEGSKPNPLKAKLESA